MLLRYVALTYPYKSTLNYNECKKKIRKECVFGLVTHVRESQVKLNVQLTKKSDGICIWRESSWTLMSKYPQLDVYSLWGPHLVLTFKHSISTCQSKPFATSTDTNSEGNLLSVQRWDLSLPALLNFLQDLIFNFLT